MDFILIDGSYGEGGGQILRTTLCLSAITGRAVHIENIRARRKKPGLAAQHLTAVFAAAKLCDAELNGAELGSRTLRFAPRIKPRAGEYRFDVAEARRGGSAGAVSLVLQTVLLPLALAEGDSCVVARGGTHVPLSPSFDYLHDVWLPYLKLMGVGAELSLERTGWYPIGKGEVRLEIKGIPSGGRRKLHPLKLEDRGELIEVFGRGLAANLPEHVSQRMAQRAETLLRRKNMSCRIDAVPVRAACPGAGTFLVARYERALAGFGALGERGKPAEQVAEDACAKLLEHDHTSAAVDEHLADQLVLPCALADGESGFTVDPMTRHLATNAWVVERFGIAEVELISTSATAGLVRVFPSP
ncbi:RNA 3'-terminal-phosphate cyclase [Methylocaldum marinum]|uniref:RNA 3'-terminal phosphate cyclase n=1 Tax=Methylocaldum marinum TaxID=1432792 RepID=A0A250KZQ0_9GAMM|nr:RNA 3'-terminal phosphate cyclase [Methylocaldum marinum]BBA37163.1 RNA 3'-terminal-phosphate cyclase [Methylocaldum marinum]